MDEDGRICPCLDPALESKSWPIEAVKVFAMALRWRLSEMWHLFEQLYDHPATLAEPIEFASAPAYNNAASSHSLPARGHQVRVHHA